MPRTHPDSEPATFCHDPGPRVDGNPLSCTRLADHGGDHEAHYSPPSRLARVVWADGEEPA